MCCTSPLPPKILTWENIRVWTPLLASFLLIYSSCWLSIFCEEHRCERLTYEYFSQEIGMTGRIPILTLSEINCLAQILGWFFNFIVKYAAPAGGSFYDVLFLFAISSTIFDLISGALGGSPIYIPKNARHKSASWMMPRFWEFKTIVKLSFSHVNSTSLFAAMNLVWKRPVKLSKMALERSSPTAAYRRLESNQFLVSKASCFEGRRTMSWGLIPVHREEVKCWTSIWR